MNCGYVVKFTYCSEAVVVPLVQSWSFVELCNAVRSRLKILNSSSFMLRYSIPPDSVSCLLENDVDMKMMFRSLTRFNSDYVEIMVSDIGCSSMATSSESVAQSCISENSLLAEIDYLGCFRPEEGKTYLTKGWESYIHSEGQKFEGGVVEFREKLRKYAIEMGFRFVFVRNDKSRVIAECFKKLSDGCNWSVKAHLCKHNGFFYITSLLNVHTCCGMIRLQKTKVMGSQIVKSIVIDQLRSNPNKRAIEIVKEIKASYGLDVPYRTVWYGKELAKTAVHGNEADSYGQLVWYCESVMQTNSDSRIVLECDPETYRFQRMFVCYGGCIKGFGSCRPILFIDATFVKNKYKGQLIGATAKDANQGINLYFTFSMSVT